MKRMAMALVAGMLALAPASAQDLDDQVTVVEELIARPRIPGPAWWKVSDADSAVYVLVNLERAPVGLQWDQTVMKRRVATANRLITPTDISINPVTFTRAVFMLTDLRDGQTAESRLSPAGQRKFRRVLGEMGKGPRTYDGYVPIIAAIFLEGDYLDYRRTTLDGVQRALEQAAKPYRVRTQRGATIPATRVRYDKRQLAGKECLEVMVAKLEIRAAALEEVAQAWAKGDVRPILFPSPESKVPDDCDENKGTNFAGLTRELIAEQVRTFEQALRTPGHAVALIDAEELLVRDGILEQLKAKGYQVTTPNLIED